jgi:hypothetical protein
MTTTSELAAGIIGGLVGGVLGVVSTLIGSYHGPKKLEQWRARQRDAPKKELLMKLLNDKRFPQGRFLETMQIVTGTSEEECRRLLIECEARGVILRGSGRKEVWALLKNMPLDAELPVSPPQ